MASRNARKRPMSGESKEDLPLRSRPQRIAASKVTVPASDDEESPPTKRGRGRPPKSAKGRGRPRKNAPATSLTLDDAVQPPAKRPRGRPPKSASAKTKTTLSAASLTGEVGRLQDITPWRRWGPYLSERQWGTVREDCSLDGNCWDYFTHAAAAYRAYQWGEDGLFGFCDEGVNVCMSLALWNGKDEMLKERLFGLTANQGNHAEDVKELYYYVEAVPSHAYQRMLYKYPQAAFPYEKLTTENARRTGLDPEYELLDTDVFGEDRYWDVEAEYVKISPGALLCRYTVHNRGPEDDTITVLPQAWFRNTWSWDCCEDHVIPTFEKTTDSSVKGSHHQVGQFQIYYGKSPGGDNPTLLFTNNETNKGRLAGEKPTPCAKDAFHSYVLKGDTNAVSDTNTGSKVAALYRLDVPSGGSATLQYLLIEEGADIGDLEVDLEQNDLDLDQVTEELVAQRKRECADFYHALVPKAVGPSEYDVATQAYAGLLWTKQFFFYDVHKWLKGGDPKTRINQQWHHMVNKDIISMPDTWEFPWYATWDLAFHMVPFGHVDIEFAKNQLLLFLSDRYMHPNGQLPAYEFNFSDVNPPVHAWACLHIYRQTQAQGKPDNVFLKKCFHRLLLNFNWWVNQKSVGGSHLYAGGFLGMDNITAVERSNPPEGTVIKQADGTGWMAFYSTCMLQIALQFAEHDEVYADMACRFLDHFIAISEEINGEKGLWDEKDHFYYDKLDQGENTHTLRVRSLVGLLPLVATAILDGPTLKTVRRCSKQLDDSFYKAEQKGIVKCSDSGSVLLSVPSADQLRHLLTYMLNEDELLSPYGVRSLSKAHKEPFTITINDEVHSVHYCPGEGDSAAMFGGNSNWRGPVWICLNFLLIEALQKYQTFHGSDGTVEYPTISGKSCSYGQVADDIAQRIVNIFLPDSDGHRPVHGGEIRYAKDPHWKDLVLFNEYFHGDTGRGCGASHQTGWTALVVCLLRQLAQKAN